MTDGVGLFYPEAMARTLCRGLENGQWSISLGFNGLMLDLLTIGTGPARTPVALVLQLLLWPLVRLVSLWSTLSFDKMIYREAVKKEREKTLN